MTTTHVAEAPAQENPLVLVLFLGRWKSAGGKEEDLSAIKGGLLTGIIAVCRGEATILPHVLQPEEVPGGDGYAGPALVPAPGEKDRLFGAAHEEVTANVDRDGGDMSGMPVDTRRRLTDQEADRRAAGDM